MMRTDGTEAGTFEESIPPMPSNDPRLGLPEADLQEAVIAMAGHLGWAHYHTHDSRRSPAGFPDLVLAHPKRGVTMFVELKATKGRISRAQGAWLHILEEAGNQVAVWRPAHWYTGHIEDVLR